MPLYDYKCPNEHWQEFFMRIGAVEAYGIPESIPCGECGEEAVKQLTTFSVKVGEQSVLATSNWRRERICPNGHTYDGSYFGSYCPRCRQEHKISMGGPEASGSRGPNADKKQPTTTKQS